MEKVLNKRPQTILVQKSDVLGFFICLSGFFLGRVTILDFLSPVGVAYLATCTTLNLPTYLITAVFIVLGTFTRLTGRYMVKYIPALILIALPNAMVKKLMPQYKAVMSRTLIQASIAATATFLANSVLIFQDGFSTYYSIIAFMETVFVFSLTYIFKKSTLILLGVKKRRFLNNEEIISLALLVGCVIVGSSDITIGAVTLRYLLIVPVLLYSAIRFGSTAACCAGLLLGITLYMSKYSPLSLSVMLALSALSAGLCRSFGRLGVIMGLTFSYLFFAFLIDPSMLGRELFISSVCGTVLFLFIPQDFSIIKAMTPSENNADDYLEKIKFIASDKLIRFSNAFERLSKTFERLSEKSEKKPALEQKDLSILIDKVGTRVCIDCERNLTCWETDFYGTYKAIFAMLEELEKTGKISSNDEFISNCTSRERFVEVLEKQYELSKAEQSWQNKLTESRQLVAQQLYGVSEIMKNMSGEIDFNLNFKEELSDQLVLEFRKHKIDASNVILSENKNGRYEINMCHRACYGKKVCRSEIIPIAEQFLKRKLTVSDECNYINGRCRLRVVEEQNYRITGGIAKMTKTGTKESGDSFSFLELKDGQTLLVLSDGMGSGKVARDESTAVVELLEEFLESGFEKNLAIKMINSVLLLRANNESFSTLDICSIDLYSGDAEFVKIGAATTFLIRGRIVEPIRSQTLPIGIFNNIEPDTCIKKLRTNDFLVMMTDGVENVDEKLGADWLVPVLSRFNGSHPQELADYILNEVTSHTEEIKDDITVLTAAIWKPGNN